MLPIYILVLIGIVVGALTGITGASGVIIVVPALSYLGLSFYDAIGSSLLVDVITTTSVIFVYFKNGNVDYKISLLLGLGAIIGAQIRSRIAFVTPERTLEIAFIIFSVYMAYVSFRRSSNSCQQLINIKRLQLGKASFAVATILSIIIGIITGTLGASGGIMFIAVMMLLFSIDVKKMVGTATLAMFLSATSGATAYIIARRIDIFASVIIGLVSLTSGYYFAKIANKMASKYIYIFLGSVFLTTSVSELLKVISIHAV